MECGLQAGAKPSNIFASHVHIPSEAKYLFLGYMVRSFTYVLYFLTCLQTIAFSLNALTHSNVQITIWRANGFHANDFTGFFMFIIFNCTGQFVGPLSMKVNNLTIRPLHNTLQGVHCACTQQIQTTI